MISPPRTRSVRPARPRQMSPKTRASSASGYSQPISGPNRLPTSLVQPPRLPRKPATLTSWPAISTVSAPAGLATGPPRRAPPRAGSTAPGTVMPKRSSPL